LAPSFVSVAAGEQLPMPESASVPVKLTVTFVLFQPRAFACGEAAACAMGGVLSIFTTGEMKVDVFPATSVTVTLPLTEAPSVLSSSGLDTEVDVTPDSASVGAKANATFVLFQPAALADGAAAVNVSVGGVLSIFTAGDVKVALLPATSVTVMTPLTADPSADSNNGLGIDVAATPDRLSAVVNVNATFVLFQPAAFGKGLAAPKLTVGGVLSILILVAVEGGLTLPALSVHVPDAD